MSFVSHDTILHVKKVVQLLEMPWRGCLEVKTLTISLCVCVRLCSNCVYTFYVHIIISGILYKKYIKYRCGV